MNRWAVSQPPSLKTNRFEQALRKVLLPLGLVYRYHEGQYLVGVADPSSALFPMLAETYEYRPQNLSPQELLPLLPERLQNYVRVIEKRNLMIIEAPRDMAHRIIQQLQQSDEPVPQVLLEAMVCVFNPNRKFNFNAELRQSLNLDGTDVLDIGTLGLAVTGFISPIGLENAFSDFARTSTFLRLLAQEGYVTIRATPRVMAKDGREGEHFYPARNLFRPAACQCRHHLPAGRAKGRRRNRTRHRSGHPRRTTVTVTIERAEVSEDIREIEGNTVNLLSQFPLINRRQVSTTVHVKDGQTIVIGGLMQRQTVDRLSEVPYLSAIPVLGKLFERIEQEDEAAEVAIFISPRIIHPNQCNEACPTGPVGTHFADQYPASGPAGPPIGGPHLAPQIGPGPSTHQPPAPGYMPSVQPQPIQPPTGPAPSAGPQMPSPRLAPPADDPPPDNIPQPSPTVPPTPNTSAIPQTQLRFVLPKPAINTSTPEPSP